MSVMTTSASIAASAGSRTTLRREPVSSAIAAALLQGFGSGSWPSGHASVRCMPARAAPMSSVFAMLLPSPRYAACRPRETALLLPDREKVGEHLAGMVVVGERVDDGDARMARDLLEVRLRERAQDDAVDVALEHLTVSCTVSPRENALPSPSTTGVRAEAAATRPRS